MQNITKYSGEGGAVQRAFVREIRAAYHRMLRSPCEHQLNGFGEWEFINQLGEVLRGEAKDVLAAFQDDWDFENEENVNIDAADDAERRRQIWREYRCDHTAFKTLRTGSGYQVEPIKPWENEPRDLDRFIDALRERFRSSTTENLSAISAFRPTTGETPERMFARFNLLAKPLEDERPRLMTVDQLKTSYIHHLKQILTNDQALELSRDIKDAERNRDLHGLQPLTRHEIHALVLRQDREGVIEQTKLRAVGLNRIPVKDRLGERMIDRLEERTRDFSPPPRSGRNRERERERRYCNLCKNRGHLSTLCPERFQPEPRLTEPVKAEMGDTKRQATDYGNPGPNTKARTAMTDKLSSRFQNSNNGRGGRGGRSRGRGRGNFGRGGRNNERGVFLNNKHMTEGATCSHCGIRNHTADQCWSLHKELNPYQPRTEHINMVKAVGENLEANKRWEAEHLAREERSARYEKERDDRVKNKEEQHKDEPEDVNGERYQYMVDVQPDDDSLTYNEAAQQAEEELQFLDKQESIMTISNHTVPSPVPAAIVNSLFPRSGEGCFPPTDVKRCSNNKSPKRFYFTDIQPSHAITRSMAHVRRSPRIEANTGKKQVHFQNPRPVIKRAQNHVVPRHVSLSPPPQDSPAASPPLSTTGDTTPRRSVQLDKDPPVTTSRSSRIRRLPAGGEVQLDPDNPHLPRTFPIQDVGKPTPGTTFLNEPPEELLPPPPPRPTCETRPSSVPGPSRQRRLSSPANSDTSHESLPPQVTAYHQVNTLCRDIDIIRNQAIAVQRNLFQVMKDESRPRPLPVMVIHHENLLQDQVERYHEAQVLSGKKYSMATLITGQSQLIIEGRIPRVAVIDTGASSVIVGRAFGLHMDECQPENLIFGDTFVTAGGTKEKGLGRTINHLKFVLAKGTQAETTITAPVIIADTDAYDVILGMDFLGACFGYVDPLTEEFVWRVDCHKTETMPTIVARLPAKCRSKVQRETRHSYMLSLIDDPKDLQESILGEETKEEDFKEVHYMEIDAETVPAPMHVNTSTCAVRMTSHSPLTSLSAVHRRHEASARLDAIKRMNNPSIPPRTKWIGGSNHGALPINTTTQTFEKIAKTKGLHVLDLFAGISCGGLRTVLEAGYLVSCYTSVEIDDISRIIARKTLSDLQEQYPGQLPDKAIRGYNKRIPQNIQLISDNDLCNLVQQNGTINFVCGGWECQPMSMAGKHLGMDDDRFMPFLDMVRIINFLQANQIHPPLYLFENTYPGTPGQYPLIDDTAKMVESFLGAPIVLDAAGMGSAAHRVRLFWTNWEQSNILQKAIPQDKYPEPSLESILHHDHVSTVPVHTPVHPFVKHNKQGRTRKCMPTIVSYPKSHAYRTKENGKPGEGQLWNKTMKRWDEPSLNEKEQMMGYNIDATKAGHVTIGQRAMRLGQAMDGNTMRWLGAFLYATQRETTFTKTPPFDKPKSKVRLKSILKTSLRPVDNIEDHHHQACAIVEQITTMENFHPDSSLGGSVSQNKRPKIDIDNNSDVDKKKISDQDTKKQSWETEKPRWKIGPNLKERDQLQVLKVLTDNNDRFAYKIEELERYTGPPMEIKLNSHEDIFRPPHKLGEKEWTFVGEQCAKLEKMGFIRKSHQSNYASATVVVRKKDENGEYTDLRKCGDYRPLNLETDLDRYQLPLIESIFNDMKGAQIFSKLDLRSGYHQMALLEADRAKTAFWGAQRILWEWCVVPFGLKNAPSYFQKQMDKVLLNLSFARCYIC